MKFKVKAKTMFVDAEAKKTRDHGEEFVVSATRYALMDERKLVIMICSSIQGMEKEILDNLTAEILKTLDPCDSF